MEHTLVLAEMPISAEVSLILKLQFNQILLNRISNVQLYSLLFYE